MIREVIGLFVTELQEVELEIGLKSDISQTFQLGSIEPNRLGRETWLGTAKHNSFIVPIPWTDGMEANHAC